MPSPGLQIFGAGLRLQKVFPGVQDVGNANISGTMAAGGFTTAPGATPSLGHEIFGHGHTNTVELPTPVVIFGISNTASLKEGVVLGWSSSKGNQYCVAIGSTAFAGSPSSGPGCVAIGRAVNAGASVGNGMSVAIGSSCIADRNSNTAIGRNVSVTSPGPGSTESVGVGSDIAIINPVQNAVAFGRNISVTGNNVLAIGNRNGLPVISRSNTIAIGRPDQDRVELGALTLQGGGVSRLFSQTQTVSATNTAAETTISGTGQGTFGSSPDQIVVGTRLRIQGMGVVGTGAGAQTLRIRVKTAGGVLLFDTGTITVPPSLASCFFVLESSIVCRTIGVTGTVKCNGRITILDSATGTAYGWTGNIAGTVTLDTTQTQTLSVTAQWGTASPSNALDYEQMTMEQLA